MDRSLTTANEGLEPDVLMGLWSRESGCCNPPSRKASHSIYYNFLCDGVLYFSKNYKAKLITITRIHGDRGSGHCPNHMIGERIPKLEGHIPVLHLKHNILWFTRIHLLGGDSLAKIIARTHNILYSRGRAPARHVGSSLIRKPLQLRDAHFVAVAYGRYQGTQGIEGISLLKRFRPCSHIALISS